MVKDKRNKTDKKVFKVNDFIKKRDNDNVDNVLNAKK